MARTRRNSTGRATIALCMMVKDEGHVVLRALASALPWIDAYSLYDTGSTDQTPALVQSFMEGHRGRVTLASWVNFAVGRTAAYEAARELGTDYVLIMDADQTLEVVDPEWRSTLGEDAYNIPIRHGPLTYPHPWLLRTSHGWCWEGATHEYVHCERPYTVTEYGGVVLVEHADSSRRLSGRKAREDRELLEAAHAANPDDPRTIFYLAQLAGDTGDRERAVSLYERRVSQGGWPEEVWMSQYRIGRLHEGARDWERAVVAYLKAYSMDPTRIEPLYRLGRGELMQRRFHGARLFFGQAIRAPKPSGRLFLEDAPYDYASRWGLSMAERLTGQHGMAEHTESLLLESPATPERVKHAIHESRTNRAIGSLPE